MSRSRRPLRLLESVITPHGFDRYLELVHPMLAVRNLRAVVTAVEHSTRETVVLTLRPGRQWRGFAAGQYVQLAVDIGGVRHVRCFSPSSSQHRRDGRLELTIKAHARGLVGPWLYRFARPGLVVGLAQAAGAFRMPHPRPPRLLLISGGSGITPVLSMLRTLADEHHAGDVVLLHYARTEADVPHLSALRAAARANPHLHVHVMCTGRTGHFQAAHLAGAAPWYARAETFLCGPESLTAAVTEHYSSAGIAASLHKERFRLVPVPAGGNTGGQIRFGDLIVGNSGATLLEQAEAAGLAPAYGCRMGICYTCPKVKIAGCTRDVRNGALHTEPDRPIQLCVSVPVGDVAIEM